LVRIRRIGNAVKFRDVPNAVWGTGKHKPLVVTGKAFLRADPKSEDRPDGDGPFGVDGTKG